MRRFVRSHWILAVALLAALPAFAQGDYKGEALSSPAPADVPKALQDALQAQGARLLDAQGKPLGEIWLAKAIAGQASSGSGDVIYGSIAQGAFVGVLHYPGSGSDFRGQSIKSGYYSLRYDLIPQDGNHMGVSQYRDFLLLVPVAQDTDPTKPLKFEDVVKLSRAASGTGHPSVLSLDPADSAPGSLPGAFKDDSGNWAIAAKTQVQAGGATKDLTMAIVLVGKYQG